VDVLAPLIVIAVLTVVVLLVSAPLRGGASARAEQRDDVLRADLEAAREAKYREIRDAELDYRTGKLSEADWKRLDRELRAEAIDILRRLDEVAPPAEPEPRPSEPRAAAPAAAKPEGAKAEGAKPTPQPRASKRKTRTSKRKRS
jgi:cell division septation protein DedD